VGAGFSTVTPPPSQVSATSVAQAVWSYTPRSLTDIQSLVSAIQNNNPGAVPDYSDLQYVPVPYYAGQVSLTQVAAFIDNAIRNYGLAGAFGGFISNNPYNLWTTNFVQSLTLNPYLTATSLIMLITNGAVPANIAQLFLYTIAQNYYYNKWIYTITANAPSITFSANATLSTNVLIAQNITIASGVTVTCGTTTCFFIAQAFNNYGTIANQLGAPGGVPTTSENGNYGGTGGGGIVVIAVTAALGTLNVNGNAGGNAVSYSYSGNGGAGGAGVLFIISNISVPMGGTGGYSTNAHLGVAGINGGGGGGGWGYYGGSGGIATVYSFSSPNDMVTYILQGLSDWWLINVLGKTPSSTTPLTYMYGSGGGAGGVDSGGEGAGGGGGGGAGEVVAYGYNILSGNIIAVGGTGGAGYKTYSGGGGGGGGGLAFIFYGATSGSVTANLAGGIGGTGSTSNGNTGANGTAYIAAVTVNG
jgi:hypothetical protein